MEPRVTLVTLGVDDLTRAVAFYRDVVGWEPASVVDDDVAFFDLDGFILALWLNGSPGGGSGRRRGVARSLRGRDPRLQRALTG